MRLWVGAARARARRGEEAVIISDVEYSREGRGQRTPLDLDRRSGRRGSRDAGEGTQESEKDIPSSLLIVTAVIQYHTSGEQLHNTRRYNNKQPS